MENKKNDKFNMEGHKAIVESLGNPNGLLEMISYIEILNVKSQEIIDFVISRISGLNKIEDIEDTTANEIIEHSRKAILELEEIIDKAIEYRKKYEEKYFTGTEDNASEIVSNILFAMLESSIASADETVFGSIDLIELLKSNANNIKLNHTLLGSTKTEKE